MPQPVVCIGLCLALLAITRLQKHRCCWIGKGTRRNGNGGMFNLSAVRPLQSNVRIGLNLTWFAQGAGTHVVVRASMD